jgi:HD-GYP domain-containing protein (c-di-GMP phosphodiesterase class II)
MSERFHKISPDRLLPGMYIEELDRPWLETPLKFQGFRVRSEHELKWIRDNCAFVVVDTGKSDSSVVMSVRRPGPAEPSSESALLRECLQQMVAHGPASRPVGDAHPPAALPPVQPQPRVNSSRIGNLLKRFASPKSKVTSLQAAAEARSDQEMIREQVASANHTYQRAKKILLGVMDEIRAGGELDVPSVEKAIYPVIDSVLQSTDAMACVMRMKEADDYTYNHSLATSIWAVVFGKSLGFDKPNLQILGMGGLLLDIGKTRIPRELLLKQGPLDPAEMAELRRHVDYSVEILRETGSIHPKIEQMVQTHHERHDGSGYPAGLKGHAIPVFGRIAGLVDTYDAMTSLRPVAPAQSTYNVMRALIEQADVLFQAEMIERFIRVVGIFPTASLVELNTGEVGIVVEQNPLRRLRPKVMLILDASKGMRKQFPVVDLGEMQADTAEADGVWILHGLEPGSFGLDPREYYL